MYRFIMASAVCCIVSMPAFAATKLTDSQLAEIAGGAHPARIIIQSNSSTVFQNTTSTSIATCVNCNQAVAISSAANTAITTQINLLQR